MSQLRNDQPVIDIRPEQTRGDLLTRHIIESVNSGMHTLILGLVTAVNNVDSVEQIGTCSVKPMVKQRDGSNNAYERGIIENVPYFRFQGGKNAIICDPKVGDIGAILFCERDISMIKRNRVESAPNTKRQYDLNDALYLGSYLTTQPEQYIQFLESGINIKTTGDVNINGMTIKASGEIVTKDGVVLDNHIHSQASDSHGDAEQDTSNPHN